MRSDVWGMLQRRKLRERRGLRRLAPLQELERVPSWLGRVLDGSRRASWVWQDLQLPDPGGYVFERRSVSGSLDFSAVLLSRRRAQLCRHPV